MEIWVVLIDVYIKGKLLGTEMYADYFSSYDVALSKLLEDEYQLDEYNEYVKNSGKYTYEAVIVSLDKGE